MLRNLWRRVYWCWFKDQHWSGLIGWNEHYTARCKGCGRLI